MASGSGGHSGCGRSGEPLPLPGQELVQAGLRDRGDAREDVGNDAKRRRSAASHSMRRRSARSTIFWPLMIMPALERCGFAMKREYSSVRPDLATARHHCSSNFVGCCEPVVPSKPTRRALQI